jgi:hypothetical protein
MTNWSKVKRALKGTSAAVHSERVAGCGASLTATGSSGPTSRTATSWPSTRWAPACSTRLKRSETHARLASGALTTSVEPSSRRASSASR